MAARGRPTAASRERRRRFAKTLSLDTTILRETPAAMTGGTQFTYKEWDFSSSGLRAWQIRGKAKSWFVLQSYHNVDLDYWWAVAKAERGASSTSVVDLSNTADLQDKLEDKKVIGWGLRFASDSITDLIAHRKSDDQLSLKYRFPTVSLDKDESIHLVILPNVSTTASGRRWFQYKVWYRGLT